MPASVAAASHRSTSKTTATKASSSPRARKPKKQQQPKNGPLRQMVDAAAANVHGVKWSHIIDYLDAHCHADFSQDNIKLPFESPFPAHYVACETLAVQLVPCQATGGSILRTALPSAPARVVAILCQLEPAALRAADAAGRLPLHYACRYPVSDQLDQVMRVIVAAYPAALLQRDTAGRTPLHYLFWHSAPQRSPEMVAAFCQRLPKTLFYQLKQFTNHHHQPLMMTGAATSQQPYQFDSLTSSTDTAAGGDDNSTLPEGTTNTNSTTPTSIHEMNLAATLKKYPLPEIPRPSKQGHVAPTAAVIPDAAHGCLPLHYAIMNGANLRAVYVLMNAYPLSKHVVDRYGRTALHWYLGAGTLEGGSGRGRRHVSGEMVNDNDNDDDSQQPWWDHDMNTELIQKLLSSRVARTADRTGRYPLHWACAFLAHNYHYSNNPGKAMPLQVIQLLLNHYVGQIICCDEKNQTPLFCLLDTTRLLQHYDWKTRRADLRRQHNLIRGGPAAFNPPTQLLELLCQHPDLSSTINVATIEDLSGRLPLHVAAEIASAPAVLEFLLEYHPAAVVHTAENLMVPLHAAFCREYAAPLQTAATINLLLATYEAGRHGSVIDGRIGLKMEDCTGNYAAHYACQNTACLQVIETLTERYPQVAMLQGPAGDLPVHCLLTDELIAAAASLPAAGSSSADNDNDHEPGDDNDDDGIEERLEVVTQKMALLVKPLTADKQALTVVDSKWGMLPLHIAVLFEAAPYQLLLHLLELFPEAALQHTSDPSYSFSALDFHDLRRAKWTGDTAEWQHIRELLYSFGPTLESHRHRQELLSRCVQVIVNELSGTDTYHLDAGRAKDEDPPDLELTHTVSNMENVVLKLYSKRKHVTRSALSPKRVASTPAHGNLSSSARQRRQQDDSVKSPTAAALLFSRSSASGTTSIYDDENTSLQHYNAYGDDDHSESSSSRASGASGDESFTDEDASYTDGDEHDGGTEGPFSASRVSTSFEDSTLRSGEDDDGGSGGPPRQSQTFASESTGETLEQIFEVAKKKAEEEEKMDRIRESMEREKKEEEKREKFVQEQQLMLQKEAAAAKTLAYKRPAYLSEVSLRLWTFFVLYCDPHNPGDNYVGQVADILDGLKFSIAQALGNLDLPPFAARYLGYTEVVDGLTYREGASPKCRELIHKTCYFLGKYEFDISDDILIHKSSDGSSVLLRTFEWMFTTEEDTDAVQPGMTEEQIWSTGEVPAQLGTTFHSWKRPVWMKFTKSSTEYHNEVKTRETLGIALHGVSKAQKGIVPLLCHYSAFGDQRKEDQTYQVDATDDRFKSVRLYGRNPKAYKDNEIVLKDYPYAIVYPVSARGSLHHYFLDRGVPSSEETREICLSLGHALKSLHEERLVHGALSMSSCFLCIGSDKKSGKGDRWSIGDLALTGQTGSSFLGAVSSDGTVRFRMDTLPPEMFARLSPSELKTYQTYWQAVEKLHNITVDKELIEPMIDFQTGEAVVVKCHYEQSFDQKVKAVSLPPLPYELIKSSPRADLWAYGNIMFTLLSGRSLFSADARSGRPTDHRAVCNWSEELADQVISEHIKDPLAQEVLLRLFTAKTTRSHEGMLSILCRPYFVDSTTPVLRQSIAEKRSLQSAHCNRLLTRKVQDGFQKSWLSSRTVDVALWDFDLLERIHLSPSGITRSMASAAPSTNSAGTTTPNFVVLPYRFSLAWPDVSDRHAEKMAKSLGKSLLNLSKACIYVQAILEQQHAFPQNSASLLDKLALDDLENFLDLRAELSRLGSTHVELFRGDIGAVAMILLRRKVQAVLDCYDTNEPLYLYPMDEFNGVPAFKGSYPLVVTEESREKVVQHCLLSMYLGSLYVRGVSQGLSGLVKMLLPTKPTAVPGSWVDAAQVLHHKLDETAFCSEMKLLEEALLQLFGTRHTLGDDLAVVQEVADLDDPRRTMADMHRVTAGGASFWTTETGVAELQEMARSTSFQQALLAHRMMMQQQQ